MKTLLFLLMSLCIIGCGTIPKYGKGDFVQLKDLRDIEGEYNNYPENETKFEYQTINNIVNWKANKTDTNKILSVTIKITKQAIEFRSHNANGQTTSRNIGYKLNDNGFLYLKNRNFRITGIPMVLGSYNIKKLEIGLTSQKDLIINGIEESGGGLFVILSSSFPRHNFNFIFKRK